MKTSTQTPCSALILLLLFAWYAPAAVRYVNVNNLSPVPPYTTWATAATNIQDAVDAAAPSDQILVTNGVYQTGGRAVGTNLLVNRVAVTKPVRVQSVNGPDVTVIRGYQVPGSTNGVAAIRCVYLGEGAGLSGFTLTNGATRSTGDWNEQLGGGVWCESDSSTLSNCIISGNAAYGYGGGDYQGTLKNCLLTGNSASYAGGGYGSTLYNCALTGNAASGAGGAGGATLYNCTLTGNAGGGVSGNNSLHYPLGSTLYNCILYYNTTESGFAANYTEGSFLDHCCTTPLPPAGTGNITNEPGLVSASFIAATSLCRGVGSATYATGTDIDGELWLNPPSIGCDEYHTGPATGLLTVGISVPWSNFSSGFSIDCAGLVTGHATSLRWDFGDGTVVSNQLHASHQWATGGDYIVTLRAYNDSNPAGLAASVTVHIAEAIYYVALDSTNAVPPYTNWSTAATRIQDAIDAAIIGATVLVSHGVYQIGGRTGPRGTTNRIVVDKPLTVRSMSGPEGTIIQGYQVPGSINGPAAIRCAYLTNGVVLTGFTLTNGATGSTGFDYEGGFGGGVWCEPANVMVSNCILSGNSAAFSGGAAFQGTFNNCILSGNSAPGGAGAYYSTLNNCTVSGNSGSSRGGGAVYCTLNNCALTGNSAEDGGAADGCTLNNCTLTGNWASGGGGASESTLNMCTLSGNSGTDGGGAAYCTLNGCALSGNSAAWVGGGALFSTLNNCTLTGNTAFHNGGGAYDSDLVNCTLLGNSSTNSGGGAYYCRLNNCIVYYNAGPPDENNYASGSLNYSCTTPMPTNGLGNITNVPLFVDASNGNFRLQSNSPCINAGNNSFAPAGTDLAGNPRIAGGTVDIGAYEFQSPQSLLSYAWLQQYCRSTDGSDDFTDPDGDGHNNWQEWRAWTDPTNAVSVLRLLSPNPATNGVVIGWQSVSGQTYFLERATNLAAQPAFAPLASNLIGQADTTVFTDTNAAGPGPFYYRVGVR
jgi:hypothetical protein